MLTYEELTDICEKKRTTITDVSNRVGMSLNGLRKAMRNFALTADKLILVCQALDITPNYFFGVEATAGDIVYGDQQKGSKMKIKKDSPELSHVIEILQGELALKNEQLAAKDKTIAEKDQQIADINKQLLTKILAL